MKKQFNVRLSEETIKEISSIAKQKKVNPADVITVLVHCYNNSIDGDSIDDYFDLVSKS